MRSDGVRGAGWLVLFGMLAVAACKPDPSPNTPASASASASAGAAGSGGKAPAPVASDSAAPPDGPGGHRPPGFEAPVKMTLKANGDGKELDITLEVTVMHPSDTPTTLVITLPPGATLKKGNAVETVSVAAAGVKTYEYHVSSPTPIAEAAPFRATLSGKDADRGTGFHAERRWPEKLDGPVPPRTSASAPPGPPGGRPPMPPRKAPLRSPRRSAEGPAAHEWEDHRRDAEDAETALRCCCAGAGLISQGGWVQRLVGACTIFTAPTRVVPPPKKRSTSIGRSVESHPVSALSASLWFDPTRTRRHPTAWAAGKTGRSRR